MGSATTTTDTPVSVVANNIPDIISGEQTVLFKGNAVKVKDLVVQAKTDMDLDQAEWLGDQLTDIYRMSEALNEEDFNTVREYFKQCHGISNLSDEEIRENSLRATLASLTNFFIY